MTWLWVLILYIAVIVAIWPHVTRKLIKAVCGDKELNTEDYYFGGGIGFAMCLLWPVALPIIAIGLLLGHFTKQMYQ